MTQRMIASIFLFLILGASLQAQTDRKPTLLSSGTAQNLLTPEQLWSLKRVSDPQISPDGTWVLFTINTVSIEENKGNTDLYLVPAAGGAVKQLTTSKSADFSGRWSPDGRTIAFLSTRDGAPQLYTIDVTGGEAKRLTDQKQGVANFSWSPDGKYFSFTTDVKVEKSYADRYPDLPAQPLSELRAAQGLCRPFHRGGCSQAHRFP